MKNLDESLIAKKNEIEEIKIDISAIKKTAATLKPAVQDYNLQMQKAHDLDKIRKAKEKEYNTVVSFLQKVDEHYLDGMFPLFSNSENSPLTTDN